MNSFSIPKPIFQTISVRREVVTPKASTTEGLAMIKALGWAATMMVVALLVWQLSVEAPFLPKLLGAALLTLVSLLAGISIGAGGSAAYIRDVHRLNKVLAEQHHDLEELNAIMLKQMNAEVEAPASSERV